MYNAETRYHMNIYCAPDCRTALKVARVSATRAEVINKYIYPVLSLL